MALRWRRATAKSKPKEGAHVVVYNGRHIWSTRWRDALTDSRLRYPVTRWLPAGAFGLPMHEADAVVDDHSTSIEHVAKLRRAEGRP